MQVSRSQPSGVVTQVVETCGSVLEDVPVRIYCKLQFIVFNRTPDRLAVETNENRRRLSKNNSGWIAFQTVDVLRIDYAFISVSQYSIEGDDAVFVRNIFLELRYDLLRLFLRKSLKICLNDLDPGKLHQSLFERNFCVCFKLDRSECRLLLTFRHTGDGRVGYKLLLILPACDLWLIQHDLRFARKTVTAWPATIGSGLR